MGRIMLLKSSQKQFNHGFHHLQICGPVRADHYYSRSVFSRKPDDIAEIKIKCYQASSLFLALEIDGLVICSGQIFLEDTFSV